MRLIDADKLPLDIEHEDIDDAPTIDAVEVVRCKDCKFCLIHTQWCKRLNKMTNGNWFCAAGERKEQSDG